MSTNELTSSALRVTTEVHSASAAADNGGQVAFETRDLRKDYQLGNESVKVLRGIDMAVPKGDYVAIMGPSGSGKSTLLNLLGCLDQPTGGSYFIAGQDVAQLNDDELSAIRGKHIGFVFQAYNLIPQLTVVENIEAPLAYRNHVSTAEWKRCRELSGKVGLEDRVDHRPNQLSGGQQQRAAIARSLSNSPQFILADEPTGNLDSTTTREILELFDELNDAGTTIVMVTHEEEVAHRARRIVRLLDGEIESDERLREPVKVETQHEEIEAATLSLVQVRHRIRDIRVGAKSLLLHPLRSLLTILGIFIGVASVIWLLAIGEGIAGKARQQIEELGANNIILTSSRPPSEQTRNKKIYSYGLTEEDCRYLQNSIPTVKMAVQFARRTGQRVRFADRQSRCEVNACTPRYRELYDLNVSRGRFLSDQDDSSKAQVCVLSQEVAIELFRHEDPVGRSVRLNRDYYRVIGIIAPRAEVESIKGTVRSQDFADNVYIPLKSFWARHGDLYLNGNNGGRGVSQITLQLFDQEDAVATGIAVTEALRRTHLMDDYTVGVPMELLQQARNTRLMFMGMMGMIATISLMVGGIGIMNIMLATVTERTREIGIRRALGARRRDITRQFIIETVLLSVCGGLTGILGGLCCGRIISAMRWAMTAAFPELMSSLPPSIQNIEPIILPESLPLAFGISVAIGVIFGMYPARRAATMNPIDALRHVS
ncbi:MAG: ABC-type lipoprotein export system ATPase subunit [Pirellulaceae bacterium]|jgi:ABC-type lipoprotein export system ATPase subunit/ABC-type antimicrobial peptide transport system permease subunit